MIEDYVTFNAAKFVKDYHKCEKQIRKLEQQLENMDMMNVSLTTRERVQSSNKSSPVETLVLRRAAIQEKIARYKEHIETYQKAEKSLTREEKYVLDQFFSGRNINAVLVDFEAKGISRGRAYRTRDAALNKIAHEVAGVDFKRAD